MDMTLGLSLREGHRLGVSVDKVLRRKGRESRRRLEEIR
jgi:hypothetical protein